MTQKIGRPAIRYLGGKWRLAPWIIKHFPKHVSYVEVFGGGASVILQKSPSFLETYNDLNGTVVNFFRVLRDRPEELCQAIDLTPYAREEYLLAQQPAEDPLERARRFAVWCWQGRGQGGAKKLGGWRYVTSDSRSRTPADDWNNMGHLKAIAERLRKVQIDNVDALVCLDRYDTPETLFYCDPPYVLSTRASEWDSGRYVCDMTDEQHIALAKKLHQVQGMVILSGYESTLYDELYSGWRKVTTKAQLDSQARERVAVECLWLSPSAVQQQALL